MAVYRLDTFSGGSYAVRLCESFKEKKRKRKRGKGKKKKKNPFTSWERGEKERKKERRKEKKTKRKRKGGVAQVVERPIRIRQVTGSMPVFSKFFFEEKEEKKGKKVRRGEEKGKEGKGEK